MAADLTVLQIARRIADAVLGYHDDHGIIEGQVFGRDDNDAKDEPTQEVLRVLHETGSWISRWDSELPADMAEVKPPAEDEPTLF